MANNTGIKYGGRQKGTANKATSAGTSANTSDDTRELASHKIVYRHCK